MPTNDSFEPDWVLLHRFLAGEASVAERAQVERWMSADPANRGLVESMRRIVEASAAPRPSRFDAREARARIEPLLRGAQIEASTQGAPLESSLRGAQRRSNLLPRHTGFASARSGLAMTTLVAACVVVALMVLHRGRVESREFVTRAGQRQSVTLSDGTQFTLAPASRLSIPVDYASGDRAVTLDGEAFFAVVHDAAHPFSVRAGNVVATDIGTRFDVRAYADDPAVRIGVTEGKVLVGAGRGGAQARRAPRAPAPVGLTAGDVVVIDTSFAVTHNADVSALTAWMQGRLVFDRTPMGDAARELSRVFDLSITVADTALARERVTAAYDNETIDQVLEDMTRAAGAVYERNGRSIVIRPRTSGAIQRPSSAPPLPIVTLQTHP